MKLWLIRNPAYINLHQHNQPTPESFGEPFPILKREVTASDLITFPFHGAASNGFVFSATFHWCCCLSALLHHAGESADTCTQPHPTCSQTTSPVLYLSLPHLLLIDRKSALIPDLLFISEPARPSSLISQLHSHIPLSGPASQPSSQQPRHIMATSNDPFTQLLITLTQENNLPVLKSHFPSLPPSTPLLHAIALQAIKFSHPAILTWCFTQGLRLPDSSINNDLYLAACTSQSIPIFQVLVDHGFDLNAHTSEVIGCGTALVAAAFRGNLEFAAWLLEHGQDPNGGFSCEAVVFAASPDNENGSLAMVQLLLKHGLRLHGTGAAIGAAEKNDVDMLKLCLENGSGMEESEIWCG
ncbi:hypothetical protein NA56DRAFT_249287 [Hyaloscypha hepaticicola]|uniref:Uncharacterized protein n=1 Tax=Hyaloscypha hepaticicola TaxID=2082293 RepID=A0A2J6PW65_9HELO|nr:hypothetical protein NA56DRAFT_249287 [Hyaloscypha hepaticicola]